MKLQIDTAQKTITVLDNPNMGVLILGLAQLFPDGEWKKYSLVQANVMAPANWQNPYVIPCTGTGITTSPSLPWNQPVYTTGSSIYNIECTIKE